jgi:hypothetical protein
MSTLDIYEKYKYDTNIVTKSRGWFEQHKMRFLLFDSLLKFKNTKELDDTTRLRYSWGTINAMSRHKLAEPCVKQYLLPHVKSQLKMINPTDWTTTLMLPVENFAKTKKNKVWGQ